MSGSVGSVRTLITPQVLMSDDKCVYLARHDHQVGTAIFPLCLCSMAELSVFLLNAEFGMCR